MGSAVVLPNTLLNGENPVDLLTVLLFAKVALSNNKSQSVSHRYISGLTHGPKCGFGRNNAPFCRPISFLVIRCRMNLTYIKLLA